MIKNRYTGKCLEIVKSKRYLYQLILFARGKLNHNHWPTTDTKITIEAYGRSGNTYLVELTKKLKPSYQQKIASHSHSFGVVKYSLRKGIPTIVLIRNPMDVVASACLKDGLFDSRGIEFHLVQYYGFYKRINDELKLGKSNLVVIDSNDLFDLSHLSMEKLRCMLKIDIDDESFSIASNASIAYLNSLHRDRPPLERSLSNSEKQKAKESLYTIIANSKYYSMTNCLYQSLISK